MPTTASPASAKALPASTWAIEPRSFFSRHYELYQGNELIVELQMSYWREGCMFTVGGHEFEIRRISMWKDGFELVSGGDVLCYVRRGFWSRRFELTTADETLHLQPVGFFVPGYELLDRDRPVGQISRAGWWTRRRVATFDTEVLPPLQVLAIFLVLIVAARQSNQQGAT
jgi:hypothetical protein